MSRGYYITRLSAPGEPVDPCAPLTFYPPKGSDELHEALKAAYPFENSLSSRMRQAVIDFLMVEQQQDQFMESPMSAANQLTPDYLPSPQSSFVSTLPSPSVSGYATFNSSSLTDRPAEAAPLPAQQDLMNVWTLPSKPDAKIHTRRTMTAEEKKAYKQKRLIGACADCKRRRRKCDHSSENATSPSTATSRKVTKRKKAVVPSSARPFATPDFSSQPETCFQAHQDTTFTDFDMSGLAGDMSFEVNADFELDTSPDFDLGFDLDIDFPLFPEVPFSSGNMETTMLPTWQGDTGAGLNAPVQQEMSFQSAYANRPLGHVMQSQDLPLTPQSLETSPMWRTQSGHSDLSESYGSSVPGGTNHNTPASQSFSTTPMSRTQSGGSTSSELSGGIPTASSHMTSSLQSVSPTFSDASYSFVDPQVLYEPVLVPERNTQQHRPSISTTDGSRQERASSLTAEMHNGLIDTSIFNSYMVSPDEIPNQSRPQTVAGSSSRLSSRQPQQKQQLLATSHVLDTTSRSSATHIAQSDSVLPSGIPGRSLQGPAMRTFAQEDREQKASGPGSYATTPGSAATQPARIPRADALQPALSATSVQERYGRAENDEPHVPRRKSSLTVTIPLYPRSPQSPGASNGDQDKFLRLLAPAQSATINVPAHSQEYAGGSNLCASLLMLACLTQFSVSKGLSLSRKDSKFFIQHLQGVNLSSLALSACVILGAFAFTWSSHSPSSFFQISPPQASYGLAHCIALWVLPVAAALVCFPHKVSSSWSSVRATFRPTQISHDFTAGQAEQSIPVVASNTQQHLRRNRSKLTKPWTSLSAVARQSICHFATLFGRPGGKVLI